MNNESKNIDIELKDDSGKVEAVFSIFNSLDSDGDVVVPGAVKSGFKNNPSTNGMVTQMGYADW